MGRITFGETTALNLADWHGFLVFFWDFWEEASFLPKFFDKTTAVENAITRNIDLITSFIPVIR